MRPEVLCWMSRPQLDPQAARRAGWVQSAKARADSVLVEHRMEWGG